MTVVIKQIENGEKRSLPFSKDRLLTFIDNVIKDKSIQEFSIKEYKEKILKALEAKNDIEADQITNILLLNSLENIDAGEPNWTFVASEIYIRQLYKKASKNRCYDAEKKYGCFFSLIKTLATKGIYNKRLLKDYTKEEIKQIEKLITPEKDKLFTYIGLRTFADRYLKKDYNKDIYELPQERYMINAMWLMIDEDKSNRIELIKDAYWALSNQYMTTATPTMSNAGASYGQLSSCFIDTVDDDLRGIYDSNTDVATLSKGGGGIGIYLGKIRSKGSDIKGFKGVSSGVLPWMKQLNNTAVSVDQLGQRQGSIAVYLDVWHKDIFSFLDAKLNNGDERQRTHDLFTGVCIPDLFMEKVEDREDWFLFDPHEVRKQKGWSLEDYFDENGGSGTFRNKYNELVDDNSISKVRVSAIDIFKRIMISQLETGTPYMFYRDTVNRANANKHKGVIYSSNLCTEIMQNMSPTTIDEEATEDGKIIITKNPGDFVVCNLSSINLARAVTDNALERLIPIQVRMLDNVIDLNTIEVLQAQITNQNYRAVGLGTFGWHHLLALKGIHWESSSAIQYADELYEEIAFLTIKASAELAEEKGAYPYFEGSDWQSGQYFDDRDYSDEKWRSLKERVQRNGVRNGYMMAVAPNGSTSIIAGSTASIDPIFQVEYSEEKKDYKIPVTAPDLNEDTFEYYKSAYSIDQKWSIRQNSARQKHIDQSISFNIYVTNFIKATELLELHMTAWKEGLKTTYYTRSTSVDIEECESCAS